ncbi:GAF domain-containing protein [Aquabacterium sp.]|uniref:GAF domain-containing protein n=1 Tax=Aquabacterium sp. TaxID=1872578 RepID=UPI003783D409
MTTLPGGKPATLDEVRASLEGVIPAVLATCAIDGTPNATYVSQMQYVDPQHVALSFQFFNKTRENILANPQATALVIDPITSDSYHLSLLYLRTETLGPLFQSMKAKLAGIASHTGMSGVFKLQGADVYRVQSVHRVPGVQSRPRPTGPRLLLNSLRSASLQLANCGDMGALFDLSLSLLAQEFGITHALLLMADEPGQRLYTVASRGYSSTGVGSEIAFGDGVIGVAAEHRVPIRINHMTMEYAYGQAARAGAASRGLALETEIPFPGLAEPHSQLAVPLLAAGRLLGVLCVESPQDLRFSYDDEDALVALGAVLAGALLAQQQQAADLAAVHPNLAPAIEAPPVDAAPLLEVRHYRQNHSIFVGHDYLIKGVAGAILWKLLLTHEESGRCDFSNRELRAATDLGLPEVSDNLEARLVLLQRRLAERCPALAIEKTGRGLFRLCLRQPVRLMDIDG